MYNKVWCTTQQSGAASKSLVHEHNACISEGEVTEITQQLERGERGPSKGSKAAWFGRQKDRGKTESQVHRKRETSLPRTTGLKPNKITSLLSLAANTGSPCDGADGQLEATRSSHPFAAQLQAPSGVQARYRVSWSTGGIAQPQQKQTGNVNTSGDDSTPPHSAHKGTEDGCKALYHLEAAGDVTAKNS